ncbi:MAG TPA: signal peptidase II [Ktedonobacterales bacterium]|jgi:signal peptidase II
MKNRPYVYDLIMLLVGALTITLDQWSKAAVRQYFGTCNTGAYIPFPNDHFGLTYACNTGAAFSLFQHGHEILLFLFIAAALAVVIWLYIHFSSQPSLLLKLSFGLVLGGAIGNLIDRFRLGYVTDFLLFTVRQVGFLFPVFNLADSAICLGIFLLMIYLWRRPTPAKRTPGPQKTDPTMAEPASAERPS